MLKKSKKITTLEFDVKKTNIGINLVTIHTGYRTISNNEKNNNPELKKTLYQ